MAHLANWGAQLEGAIPLSAPFNLGATANNASWREIYEVVSVLDSGYTLEVMGNNPKRIAVGVSNINGGFIPGLTPRLTTSIAYGSLPPTAQVRALAPSVLDGKVVGTISKINPPTSTALSKVTFTIELTTSFLSADKPKDSNKPAPQNKYFIEIIWSAVAPDRWLNLQDTHQAHWDKGKRRFTTPTVHELFDSAGGETRVLFDGMATWAWELVGVSADGTETPIPNIDNYLSTEETLTGWRTFLDLTSFDIPTTYVWLQGYYYAEAKSCTSKPTVLFQSRCTNCQKEVTGSYVVDDGRWCTAASDASEFDNFRSDCWKPGNCSRFTVKGYEESNERFAPDSPGDAAFWASRYNSDTIMIVQPDPEQDEYIFEKRNSAGVSLQGLAGAFRWQSADFASGEGLRIPWFTPSIGKRVTWTSAGGERQAIVYGAWYLAPDSYATDSGPDFTYNGSSPTEGWLSAAIGGPWESKNALDDDEQNPWEPIGGAMAVNVYQGATVGESWTSAARFAENMEQTVVSMDLSLTNAGLVSRVKAVLGNA